MIPTLPRRLGAALALVLTAALATACAGSPEPEPETVASSAPTPSTPAPEPSATIEPEVAAADPTCATIIPEDIVADFESVGWTSRADPFYIGEIEIPDGLKCVWADFEGPAGDHLQMFGWAPLDEETSADAQDTLVAEGWVSEEGDGGVYVTEPEETTIAVDAEGYGMTYYFAEGWVTVADTKQGLVLIEWPKG